MSWKAYLNQTTRPHSIQDLQLMSSVWSMKRRGGWQIIGSVSKLWDSTEQLGSLDKNWKGWSGPSSVLVKLGHLSVLILHSKCSFMLLYLCEVKMLSKGDLCSSFRPGVSSLYYQKRHFLAWKQTCLEMFGQLRNLNILTIHDNRCFIFDTSLF